MKMEHNSQAPNVAAGSFKAGIMVLFTYGSVLVHYGDITVPRKERLRNPHESKVSTPFRGRGEVTLHAIDV
jgi:hypothetical protein